MAFDLSQNSFRLLNEDPFFAGISRVVAKVKNSQVPTAGVMINPRTGYFELHYNQEFFENLGKTDENGKEITDPKAIIDRREIEARGVLKHEFYHLIFDHVTDRLPAEGMSQAWNIAADLAINGEIARELPYFACVPGRVHKDPKTGKEYGQFADMKPGHTAEYYYALIKDKIEEAKKNKKEKGEGGGEGASGEEGFDMPGAFDDHSQWCGDGQPNKIDPVLREIAKERLKDAIKDAAQEAVTSAGGRSWGNMSAHMQKEILRRLTSVVDWKSVLRYFIKTSQRSSRMNSMKRINRRYPYIQAGKKTSRTANIAVSIDQSGSVSDEMLQAFFGELNKLSEIATFTVIPFDDAVFQDKIYVWKKGEKRTRERVPCGGTNFDAPTAYVNEQFFDGHMILTDLCAPKPGASKVQRCWLTTESCAKNPYFKTNEKIIVIPDSDLRPR